MSTKLCWLPAAFAVLLLDAHPMGNFSISHYSRLELRPEGLQVHYVLDLAEIPSLELMQKWNMKSGPVLSVMDRNTMNQAREWAKNLRLLSERKPVPLHLEDAKLTMNDGAGDMAVLRFDMWLSAPVQPGRLTYEDGNFAERTGWKEIVVVAGDGVRFDGAQPSALDRSHALTAYPTDISVPPPQDVAATFHWKLLPGVVSRVKPPTAPATGPEEQPSMKAQPEHEPSRVPEPAQMTEANGSVVRGDFLSTLLGRKDLGWKLLLIGIAVAFGLGAVHALSPGHGKTMVAAYLVGSRGTPKHAVILGATVTFTHTISVFVLGFVTLFLSQYILPEKLYPILGTLSGLTIVWVGATLLWKRGRRLMHSTHHHDHHHARDHHHHDHEHDHVHAHAGQAVMSAHTHAGGHTHRHTHDHDHDHHHHEHDHGDEHHHHHGPGGHSHVPEGDITLSSLIALGVSGGLVPCPSGLVLLLSAIALGRVALGLVLLTSFSAGLAMVLTAIGLIVIYAKQWLPQPGKTAEHPLLRFLPVASAAVVLVVGIVMTLAALGVTPAGRFVS